MPACTACVLHVKVAAHLAAQQMPNLGCHSRHNVKANCAQHQWQQVCICTCRAELQTGYLAPQQHNQLIHLANQPPTHSLYTLLITVRNIYSTDTHTSLYKLAAMT